MSDRKHYPGRSVEVVFTARRCLHAGECVRSLPAVFDPAQRPWVQPDEGGAAEIERAVALCPTGALSCRRLDGTPEEDFHPGNQAVVSANGPLYLRGRIELTHLDGTVETLRAAALCRCGASSNRPFCDGSHRRAPFKAEGTAGHRSAGPAPDTGVLRIGFREHGPALLSGTWLLRTHEGDQTTEGGALCRCGASARKPFCDGSHRTSGFQD
jgi:CDGSH-type Zn-finger protein/uncharacterized Fe-S cluster protein YjdI